MSARCNRMINGSGFSPVDSCCFAAAGDDIHLLHCDFQGVCRCQSRQGGWTSDHQHCCNSHLDDAFNSIFLVSFVWLAKWIEAIIGRVMFRMLMGCRASLGKVVMMTVMWMMDLKKVFPVSVHNIQDAFLKWWWFGRWCCLWWCWLLRWWWQ